MSLASLLRGDEPIIKGKQRRFPKGTPKGGQFIDEPDQPKAPARRGRLSDVVKPAGKPHGDWLTNSLGWAKHTYEGDFPGGWTTKVKKVDVRDNGGTVIIRGSIHRFGKDSGGFTRRVYPHEQRVDHSLFEVAEHYQGGGFAKQFLHKSEDAYLDAGLKRITLHADISVGAYAWSRYGFAFDGPREAQRYGRELTVITGRMKQGKHPEIPTYDGWEADVKKVVAKGGRMTPQDIAEVGILHATEDENGYKQWTGKSMMFATNPDGWDGVKPVQKREDRSY